MKLTIRILIFMALAVMLVSSCGNRKGGKVHIKKDSAGNYFAAGQDAVADGSQFLPTAKAIFGERFDEFQKANSDQEHREQIRKTAISRYVLRNKLGVKYYKDYGWPAVEIPSPEDSSYAMSITRCALDE